jgi:carbamoyltransferase
MKRLGICGCERDAAAALSIDGVLVAAAAEESFSRFSRVGYRQTGSYPLLAIEGCLATSGLAPGDIDRIVVVDDGRLAADDEGLDEGAAFAEAASHEALARALRGRPTEFIDPLLADARQAAAMAPDGTLLVMAATPERGMAGVFHRCADPLGPVDTPAGFHQLPCAIQQVSRALGLRDGRYESLEELASGSTAGDPALFAQAVDWHPDSGLTVRDERLECAVAEVRRHAAATNASMNLRLQQERQDTAAAFCARLNAVVVEGLRSMAEQRGIESVALAGTIASSRALTAAALAVFESRLLLAPVPEPCGRAIGAALDERSSSPLRTLALGPDFSEHDIKVTLENCRLDYVYEPDWSRLLGRISRMLSHGTVVAWFQGAMGFGPRPVGTRSIICDPSNRYARENINTFLRRVPVDHWLPVVMRPEAMRNHVDGPTAPPFVATNATVRPASREQLRAAVTPCGVVPVQVVAEEHAPLLSRLLQVHEARTGVPALIHVPFCGVGEPIVCTPRDAVRTMFSSAIDALVIGRFLLMKDHWLLRSFTE